MADIINPYDRPYKAECPYRDCMKELKKRNMHANAESSAAGSSTGSGTSMMRDALCNAVLKDCQRKLKEPLAEVNAWLVDRFAIHKQISTLYEILRHR